MATITKISRPTGPVYKARIRPDGQARTVQDLQEPLRRGEVGESPRGRAGPRRRRPGERRPESTRSPTRSSATGPKSSPSYVPRPRESTSSTLSSGGRSSGTCGCPKSLPAKIAKVRDELTAAGKAPATRNRYLATLASVLTACVKDWHWLTASPMTGVSKPTEDNGGTRFLSEDELDRLLTACRESKSRDLLLAVMLSITTGGRQGEILGLRWKDLDLTAGTVHLRVDNETTTKGGIRSLPIAPQALPLLQARRDAHRQGKVTALHDDSLVFPSRVSRSKPVSLRTPWETALLRAGIESFRWHDLRHSAASFLAKGGASLLEIGAILGHKSANTTKRYAHLTEQHTNALVLDMADKLLGGR